MPELPDLEVYLHALRQRIVGQRLTRLRLLNPFVLRTVEPPSDEFAGRQVLALRRVGKRIVVEFEQDRFAVIHLMIAGRLRWLAVGKAPPKKLALAAFEFPGGTLVLTEAGSKRRAMLHLLVGEAALAAIDPGGLELASLTLAQFSQQLTAASHTLKRALTDPRLFSGIGNAYSDEILHRARLSPLQLTSNLNAAEIESLYAATRAVLSEWTDRLLAECGDGFPDKVTAFRPQMAVHGRYGQPCPDCASPVQRVVHASNELNYCARCQTGGRLLADRAMSRLLHDSWPKHLDELG